MLSELDDLMSSSSSSSSSGKKKESVFRYKHTRKAIIGVNYVEEDENITNDVMDETVSKKRKREKKSGDKKTKPTIKVNRKKKEEDKAYRQKNPFTEKGKLPFDLEGMEKELLKIIENKGKPKKIRYMRKDEPAYPVNFYGGNNMIHFDVINSLTLSYLSSLKNNNDNDRITGLDALNQEQSIMIDWYNARMKDKLFPGGIYIHQYNENTILGYLVLMDIMRRQTSLPFVVILGDEFGLFRWRKVIQENFLDHDFNKSEVVFSFDDDDDDGDDGDKTPVQQFDSYSCSSSSSKSKRWIYFIRESTLVKLHNKYMSIKLTKKYLEIMKLINDDDDDNQKELKLIEAQLKKEKPQSYGPLLKYLFSSQRINFILKLYFNDSIVHPSNDLCNAVGRIGALYKFVCIRRLHQDEIYILLRYFHMMNMLPAYFYLEKRTTNYIELLFTKDLSFKYTFVRTKIFRNRLSGWFFRKYSSVLLPEKNINDFNISAHEKLRKKPNLWIPFANHDRVVDYNEGNDNIYVIIKMCCLIGKSENSLDSWMKFVDASSWTKEKDDENDEEQNEEHEIHSILNEIIQLALKKQNKNLVIIDKLKSVYEHPGNIFFVPFLDTKKFDDFHKIHHLFLRNKMEEYGPAIEKVMTPKTKYLENLDGEEEEEEEELHSDDYHMKVFSKKCLKWMKKIPEVVKECIALSYLLKNDNMKLMTLFNSCRRFVPVFRDHVNSLLIPDKFVRCREILVNNSKQLRKTVIFANHDTTVEFYRFLFDFPSTDMQKYQISAMGVDSLQTTVYNISSIDFWRKTYEHFTPENDPDDDSLLGEHTNLNYYRRWRFFDDFRNRIENSAKIKRGSTAFYELVSNSKLYLKLRMDFFLPAPCLMTISSNNHNRVIYNPRMKSALHDIFRFDLSSDQCDTAIFLSNNVSKPSIHLVNDISRLNVHSYHSVDNPFYIYCMAGKYEI